MEENKNLSKDTQTTQSRFDLVIEWLLGGLLLFMPLAFGARDAWAEEIVIGLSGCIFICFLLKLVIDRNQKPVWSWAYIPIGLFLLIILFQLIPFSVDLIGIVSPNTVSLRTELLSGLQGFDELLNTMSITFYKNGTKHDLRLVLSVVAVFVVVLNVFRRPGQIKRLLMIIALVGGVVTLIALAQDLFGNGLRYWFVPHPYEGYSKTLSGPFVNRNHFSQFMNLSVGAAIARLFVLLHENFSGKQLTPGKILDYLSSPSAKIFWLLIAIISLGAATVFISLSRGGMISMLIAVVFTAILLCFRQSLQGRVWIMAVMAIVAFTCILFVGFDAVYDRLATLHDLNEYGSRWQILKDLSVAFGQFPLLGTGLGTHSIVYPMYQNINTTLLFTHAENEYAQAIEETGFFGLTVLIIYAICIGSAYAKGLRTAKSPIALAVYGLGFGLLAILVQSFSDYGQHVPANAFLSAILCALLLVIAAKNLSTTKLTASLPKTRVFRIFALLCVCGILLWAFWGADNARRAESHWKRALDIEKGLAAKDWQGTESEYADLISYARAAVDYEPENVRYQYGLNLYRWYSITKTGQFDFADAAALHKSKPLMTDIVNGLKEAIATCPTFGPSYSLAGQIEKFIFFDAAGAEKIRKGYLLSPCDPMACFVAGRLDILEGKPEDSLVKFEKAVQIDGGLFEEIVTIYVNHLSRPQLAISAAGDNIGRLKHVSRVLKDMNYNDLARQSLEKARSLLEIKCTQPDASAGNFAALADIYRSQLASEKAIVCYRRALELDYGQVYWRYAMAELLAETGSIQEALEEARICLRIRPQYKAAEKLVAELSVNPAGFDEKTD